MLKVREAALDYGRKIWVRIKQNKSFVKIKKIKKSRDSII